MKQQLLELCAQFPLSPKWSKPELFIEKSSLLGQTTEAIGIVAKYESGKDVFASAAGGLGLGVLKRAYFELIERTSIIEGEESCQTKFKLLEEESKTAGILERSQVFPVGNTTAPWVYSRSNGVASHCDLNLAKRSAFLEILERDAVLRSWYTKTSPTQISLSEIEAPNLDSFQEVEIRVVQFPQECQVVGVFGFSKTKNLPLFFGFGAGTDLSDTVRHAWDEALQRLIFTFDGPFSDILPPCQATPDYHLDYYLNPSSAVHIQEWLDYPPPIQQAPSPRNYLVDTSSVDFIDLTPSHLEGRLWVVKGISNKHLPLTFGNWIPDFGIRKNIDSIPHPIA
jgi:hypothetical protein